MNENVLVNGQAGDAVSVHDRGLHYGDGLFETIAVIDGAPLLWERHVRRLQHGCVRMGMSAPDATILRAELERLAGGRERAVAKILVTRGIGARGYGAAPATDPTRIVSVSGWRQRDGAEKGVSVQLCRIRLGRNPALAGIKHLNRLEQVMARAELGAGVSEGLMLNDRDEVIEGTMTNVFAVVDGELVTPDLSECGVAGVLREFILDSVPPGVRVTPLAYSVLARAEEIFLTNSIIGVWPVKKLAARELPVGPVTRRMQQLTRDSHAVG